MLEFEAISHKLKQLSKENANLKQQNLDLSQKNDQL